MVLCIYKTNARVTYRNHPSNSQLTSRKGFFKRNLQNFIKFHSIVLCNSNNSNRDLLRVAGLWKCQENVKTATQIHQLNNIFKWNYTFLSCWLSYNGFLLCVKGLLIIVLWNFYYSICGFMFTIMSKSLSLGYVTEY